MFKAVSNIRDRKGFTLIELLIVIAIIGILAAIAVPAFLGQRQKARVGALEASARSAITEVQAAMDDFQSGQPVVYLSTPSVKTCYQQSGALAEMTCANLYSGLTSTGVYSAVGDIIGYLVTHHNVGKTEVSPINGLPLFISGSTASGRVSLITSGTGLNLTVTIQARDDVGAVIFNTTVSAL